MTKVNLPDDVHARLKAYAEDRGYKSLGVAVEVLLDVRDEANRSFLTALSIIESRSASAATRPAPRHTPVHHFFFSCHGEVGRDSGAGQPTTGDEVAWERK